MKITILTINFVDNNKVYLQNRGYTYEEIERIFKNNNVYCKPIKSLNEDEIRIHFEYITDEHTRVAYAGRISNHYNKNQADINKIKNTHKQQLEIKGYTVIPVNEGDDDILFNHIDWDKARSIGESFNWSDICKERAKEAEDEYNANVFKLNDIRKQCVEWHAKLDAIQKDFNNITERYIKGKAYIEQQEIQIKENTKNIDEIRRTLPEDILNEQKKLDSIKNDITIKQQELNTINDDISHASMTRENMYSEIDRLDTNIENGQRTVNELQAKERNILDNIDKKNSEIDMLQNECLNMKLNIQLNKQQLDFQNNVLLKGIDTHTNDIIVELINKCNNGVHGCDLDKMIIGTVLTHDTIEQIYNAVKK